MPHSDFQDVRWMRARHELVQPRQLLRTHACARECALLSQLLSWKGTRQEIAHDVGTVAQGRTRFECTHFRISRSMASAALSSGLVEILSLIHISEPTRLLSI